MGSGGSKRKGRRHLPKVGTAPEMEYEAHEHQREVMRTVGVRGHGRSTSIWVWVVIGAALVALGSFLIFVLR